MIESIELDALEFFEEELSGEPLTQESVVEGLVEFAIKEHNELFNRYIWETLWKEYVDKFWADFGGQYGTDQLEEVFDWFKEKLT